MTQQNINIFIQETLHLLFTSKKHWHSSLQKFLETSHF